MQAVAPDQMAVFADPGWRRDLELLAESTRIAARGYAADAFLLASLAERVPAAQGRHEGAVAWQSFVREVAVARGIGDGAAVREVQRAQLLARDLLCTVELLTCGQVTVGQATALCDELLEVDVVLAREVDRRLRDRLPVLSPQRVRLEARRLVELLDADAAAERAARAAAGRAVRLRPDRDGQAHACLNGPAIPMTRWHLALTQTARALQQAGDPRGLDALRFDLVMGGFTLDEPADAACAHASPPPAPAPAQPLLPYGDAAGIDPGPDPTPTEAPGAVSDPAGLLWQARAQAERVLEAAHAAEADALHRVERLRAEHDRLMALVIRERLARSCTLPADRRATRPVQLVVQVPVTTLLGLSHEPGFLPGYGWVGAPQCRQLLPTAELRQACTDDTGMVIDLAERAVRTGLDPQSVREALLRMATEAFTITQAACGTVDTHDPPDAMAELARIRDRFCDGPLGTLVPAGRCELDHEVRHPDGPTAAWNLPARAKRTHRLKHNGWTPIRSTDHTAWISPAGQLVEQHRHHHAPEPLPADAQLPDPNAIHQHETDLLKVDDEPDW